MWITFPFSEKEPSLDFVKSKNCVGNAKCPGSNSCFKLPTAEGAIILVIPNSLNAQMFALKSVSYTHLTLPTSDLV